MASLFHVIATASHHLRQADRTIALKGTAAFLMAATLVSVILTGIAVLIVGERDWLSALVLAVALPLILITPLLYLFATRLIALDRHNRELQQAAREDHLTGVFNRPHLLGMLERELALSQRHNYNVSVLLIEIADFSQLLDEQGRSVGEQALRLFADCIAEKIRESDLFGRFDGAQFLLVLPHTSFEDATRMGEGLRAIVATLKLDGRIQDDGTRPFVSVAAKIGAASTENSGRNLNTLLNEADYSLYQNRNERRDKPPAAGA
ncbi:GGDEF domain-containing protein [Alcanivorax sp. S6407]|uniref:GGDEF domain-containing protein n=1 Tax=Alcanivorax sp. S6407 TaxID=2926424 RepID=UPI001FF4F55B|nr:GGDEF domain-containing protein [Alcanivorax sp. S6407]MCK0153023.1 GGDEF domain-containing protein [Alcanivorax sp. S6407]